MKVPQQVFYSGPAATYTLGSFVARRGRTVEVHDAELLKYLLGSPGFSLVGAPVPAPPGAPKAEVPAPTAAITTAALKPPDPVAPEPEKPKAPTRKVRKSKRGK